VKEFLSRAGQTFEVRNVDEDLEAYKELVGRGFRAVPVTFIGGTSGVAIRGFDEEALTSALAGAPPPAPDR
jgi:glutaredoxin